MRNRCKYAYLITFGLLFIFFNGIAIPAEDLNTSFLRAIHTKDFTLMTKLLKEGANINAPLREHLTPIAEAAALGDIEIIEFLLSKGAKPEGIQSEPNTPIYMAIGGNHVSVVKKFLDLGVDANYAWPNRDGGTLLIAAVQFGHIETVKLIVQRGADVNYCGNGDYSPLYRSIIYGHFDIFKFLLDKGACLNEQDKAALSEVEWEKVEKDKKYIQLLDKNQRCKKK